MKLTFTLKKNEIRNNYAEYPRKIVMSGTIGQLSVSPSPQVSTFQFDFERVALCTVIARYIQRFHFIPPSFDSSNDFFLKISW